MNETQWDEYKHRSKSWAVRINFDLLHSEAFKSIKYTPTLKLLIWFHEKVKVRVNKKNRARNRYEVIEGQEIAFTYTEAKLRGLTAHQISRGLQELYQFGFIDIKQPGSALRGDWTRYSLSQRWRDFATANFKELAFPKSSRWLNFGFGSDHKKYRKKIYS